MARRNTPNALTRPELYAESTWRKLTNDELLADAQARADRWQERLAAGLTARDRARPVLTRRAPDPRGDEG